MTATFTAIAAVTSHAIPAWPRHCAEVAAAKRLTLRKSGQLTVLGVPAIRLAMNQIVQGRLIVDGVDRGEASALIDLPESAAGWSGRIRLPAGLDAAELCESNECAIRTATGDHPFRMIPADLDMLAIEGDGPTPTS